MVDSPFKREKNCNPPQSFVNKSRSKTPSLGPKRPEGYLETRAAEALMKCMRGYINLNTSSG